MGSTTVRVVNDHEFLETELTIKSSDVVYADFSLAAQVSKRSKFYYFPC